MQDQEPDVYEAFENHPFGSNLYRRTAGIRYRIGVVRTFRQAKGETPDAFLSRMDRLEQEVAQCYDQATTHLRITRGVSRDHLLHYEAELTVHHHPAVTPALGADLQPAIARPRMRGLTRRERERLSA